MIQTLLVDRRVNIVISALCLVHPGPLTRKTPSRHLPNEFFSFGRNHLSGIVSGRDRWYKSRGTVIMERLIQMCAFLMWLAFMEQNFSKLHSTLKFNLSGNLVFDFVIQSLDLFVIMSRCMVIQSIGLYVRKKYCSHPSLGPGGSNSASFESENHNPKY